MKNLLFAGTASGLLMLGAVGAANAANSNVPAWSPYAVGTLDPSPAARPGHTRRVHGEIRRLRSGPSEGRAAYLEVEPSNEHYRGPSYRGPYPRAMREPETYVPPESTYGRQTPNYGPGVTYAAPVSPYRWAYSSENFAGTEFMRGR